MGSVILEAKSVTKKFDERNVLNEVSLSVERGHFIAVLGHSGSGKSTLLNVLSTILTPSSGEVFYNGKNITRFSKGEIANLRRDKIGFVFQHYMLLPNLTVRENIFLGAEKRDVYEHDKTDMGGVEKLSELLGIDKYLDEYPYKLSGGEQQRVCIARAVAKNPEILFCDEATGALDKDNSINIVKLLHEIKKKFGTTIFFTTHNREIAKTADRVLVLEDGNVINDYMNDEIIEPDAMAWGI
ncbi:MAG: ABC transporter ATP-binding protein [Butyrivibrio sp.]|nr:ABC transporter ATP-binding protein [Butyrivibrio sp.]